MNLRYEPAQEVDIETIYTFCKELIEQYETDPIDLEQVLLWCKRKITASLAEYRRILRNGDVVGYFHLCPEEKGAVELDDLYIFPEFQNRGIGTRILEKCCRESDRPVMLYVFSRNTGAWKLYQRMGFEIRETIKNTRYIMVRENL